MLWLIYVKKQGEWYKLSCLKKNVMLVETIWSLNGLYKLKALF